MTVDVIVPYSGGDTHRALAWGWVHERYRQEYPKWGVRTGDASTPWVKALAVENALRRSTADTLVIADADVWVENLGSYVERVEYGEKDWACPQIRVFRFNAEGSSLIYDGDEPIDVALRRGHLVQAPYKRMLGGGLIVIKRELYDRVPLDPRFVGWGGEDHAWGYALLTLAGDRIQGRELLWHLWHPPAERIGRATYNDESMALFTRYQNAASNVELMQSIVDEGRAAWGSIPSS